VFFWFRNEVKTSSATAKIAARVAARRHVGGFCGRSGRPLRSRGVDGFPFRAADLALLP
jgi:hypothetical protein